MRHVRHNVWFMSCQPAPARINILLIGYASGDGEKFLRINGCRGCFWHLDWLAGVRFLGFDETLGIAEGLIVPAGAGSLAGSGIIVQDSFGTRNLFVGGQAGLDIGFQRGRWSLDLIGKVALGNTHEEASINGSTQFCDLGD